MAIQHSEAGMDQRVLDLIAGMIQTERSRLGLPADKTLAAIREKFASGGALGNGRFPVLVDEACAAEYESRAEAWLRLACRVVADLSLPWSPEAERAVRHAIAVALTEDWREIYERAERYTKGGRGTRSELMEQAKTRAGRHVEHELALLSLKDDPTRFPLREKLSAQRYVATGRAWAKAQHLLTSGHDYANAIKEAVGAVEALARIVVAKPVATLGEAIKELRAADRIEAPLLKGVEELWGWTSGEPGVRHAALEEPLEMSRVRYCFALSEAALHLLLAADST